MKSFKNNTELNKTFLSYKGTLENFITNYNLTDNNLEYLLNLKDVETILKNNVKKSKSLTEKQKFFSKIDKKYLSINYLKKSKSNRTKFRKLLFNSVVNFNILKSYLDIEESFSVLNIHQISKDTDNTKIIYLFKLVNSLSVTKNIIPLKLLLEYKDYLSNR